MTPATEVLCPFCGETVDQDLYCSHCADLADALFEQAKEDGAL